MGDYSKPLRRKRLLGTHLCVPQVVVVATYHLPPSFLACHLYWLTSGQSASSITVDFPWVSSISIRKPCHDSNRTASFFNWLSPETQVGLSEEECA